MERADILELMTRLKLYGMRAAYDEVMTTGIKRRHEPARIVGELLSAEVADKQARSIKYQLTIAKLPLAKDIDDFEFTGTPINQALIRDLWRAVALLSSNAIPYWSAEPEPASRIWPLPLRELASAMAPEAASTSSSTSSTGSRPKPAAAAKAGSPNISRAWILSSSTSSVICLSRRPAASCYST